VPKFPEDILPEELDNVKNVSQIFSLPELATICDNITNGKEFLNPSIGTFQNDKTGLKMKEMFMNQDKLADVIFHIEGTSI
jgi:hypothetical protein